MEGHRQAQIHHRGIHGVFIADSPGDNINRGMDQTPRRKALATASSADLLQRGARSGSLLLAGKVRDNQTGNLWSSCGGFIAMEIIRFTYKEKTIEG